MSAPARFLIDGTETAFHDPQVLAMDDANARFDVTLAAKRLTEDRSHTVALVVGELRLVGTSGGGSGDEGWFVFRATAGQARQVAAALGVAAHKRAPWRGELTGRLEPVGDLAAGATHLPLQFTLTNTGPVTLWFLDGGRGRNELGRDNRFSFEIECEGARLATREINDEGGKGIYRRLAPGESRPLVLDLAHWCTINRAGQYAVRASYEAELMPAEYEPGKTLPIGWYGHLNRTRIVKADLRLLLR